jgi:hypothetical protein
MIRPQAWYERRAASPGLADLELRVYAVTGEVLWTERAFEEAGGLYRAWVTLEPAQLGARVILRWTTPDGLLDQQYDVLITGDAVSDAVRAACTEED